MDWLTLVLAVVIFGSFSIYIDNYISDVYFKGRNAVSQKMFFAFAFIIVAAVLAAISNFEFLNIDSNVVWLLIVAGLLSSLAGVPYYKALEVDDSTNLGIFVQITPVLYLILGWLFLGESISFLQLIAFVIIMLAPALIILTSRKSSRKVRMRAIFYAFAYVFIKVCGNLIFVKENATSDITFICGMSLVMFGKGFGNLILLALRPKWVKRFMNVYRSSHGKVLKPLFWTLASNLVKDFAYRGALVLAPSVALASAAADSAEPIVIFFMGIILTLIWPRFGREKLSKKSVLVHLAATVLVVVGIVLLQMPV